MFLFRPKKLLLFVILIPCFNTALQPDFTLHTDDPAWLKTHSQKNNAQPRHQSVYQTERNGITFCIVKKDITSLNVDAIVNAANKELSRGGGVCGAIFQAAEGNAKVLQEYIFNQYPQGIEPGQAIITPSFDLGDQGIKHIIHAVGPIYHEYHDKNQARELLKNAHIESLKLATKNNCSTVAFSFISSGIYGFPKENAAEIAIDALLPQTERDEIPVKTVYFALIHQEDFDIFKKILEQKIDSKQS